MLNSLKNNIFNLPAKIKIFSKKHKVWTVIIILAVIYSGYLMYGKLTSTIGETRYLTTSVAKGNIISTVTGTGQVSASNQLDIKAKSSGDVLYLGAVAGQEVASGKLLMQLDDTDAEKAIRDAQANLDSAKLSYAKTIAPADTLTLLQAENSLTQANISKNNSMSDLNKSYDDSVSAISNAFLDLPSIMTGLDGILHNNNLRNTSDNVYAYADSVVQFDDSAYKYRDDVIAKYAIAKAAYDKNFNDYKAVSRISATSTIEALLNETYITAKEISDVVKSMNNLIDFYENVLTDQNMNIPAIANTHLSTLNSYTGKTNGHIQTLLSQINAIQSNKDAIDSAIRSIEIQSASLDKTKSGATAIDIQSAQLSVTQRENSLADAQATLADYYIRAPFSGIIASLAIKVGDSVSSGSTVATFISKQKLAEISLNEIDAAKVKVGQKVNLTFDAVDGLNITGTVAEVDSIGAVSQGVVSYAVKISFDTQDDRVKSGMSVSASIITAVKTDVLTVPSSAVKTSGSTSYVEMFSNPLVGSDSGQGAISAILPTQQIVTVGTSNDSVVEITSGLKEGDFVVVKTTVITAAQAAASKTSTISSLLSGNRNTGNTTSRAASGFTRPAGN